MVVDPTYDSPQLPRSTTTVVDFLFLSSLIPDLPFFWCLYFEPSLPWTLPRPRLPQPRTFERLLRPPLGLFCRSSSNPRSIIT